MVERQGAPGAVETGSGSRVGSPAEAGMRQLLGRRVAVLDGAWGTLLQQSGLSEDDYRGARFADHPRDVTGDPDLLHLTQSEIIVNAHRAQFAAGADITTTNTFTASKISQA